MTQTITPDELVSLNRTMATLYEAARRLEAAEKDRDHLAGILEKVARVFDDPDEGPEDFHQLPQAVEGLRLKCETLKGGVVTAGNHAACRLNVLKDIHRTLGSDGGPTGVNTLTGVPPQMTRLPKRIEQLLADVTTWRERYNMMIAENGELVRENAAVKDAHHALWKRLQLVEGENETLARNMPPEPPVETPVVVTYDPACFRTTKVIGQAWCKGNPPSNCIGLFYPDGWICLCEIRQDASTGALTYHPLAVKDLPIRPIDFRE